MRFLFWTLRLALISSAATIAAMVAVALWTYFHPIHKITTHLWGNCPSEIDGDYTIIDIDGEKLRLPTELIESCYAPYVRRTIFDDPRTITLSGNLSDFAKFTGQTDPLPVDPPIKVAISGKIPGVRYQDKTVEELNSINTTDLVDYIEFAYKGGEPGFEKSNRKYGDLEIYEATGSKYLRNYDLLLPAENSDQIEFFLACGPRGEDNYENCKSNRFYISEYCHFEIFHQSAHIEEAGIIYKFTSDFFANL